MARSYCGLSQALSREPGADKNQHKLSPCPRPRPSPSPVVTHGGEGILGKPWYWCYVLLALTICYIVNVMDRSQILAASLQAIKAEFGATDFQLGLLSGIPVRAVLLVPRHSRSPRWPTGGAA